MIPTSHETLQQDVEELLLRQFEVTAEQMVSAWLDGEMDRDELRQFLKGSFQPRLVALAAMMDEAFKARPKRPDKEYVIRLDESAWLGARHLIDQMQSEDSDTSNCGDGVVSLLVAAMVLRQLQEHSSESLPNPRACFVGTSTNVAPEFFTRCVDKLGWRPFGAAEGSRLIELAERLAALAQDSEPCALNPPREQSA